VKTTWITTPYNRAQQLFRGMYTVMNQKVVPNEVVIVDDGSKDTTQEVYEKLWRMSKGLDHSTQWSYIPTNHPEHRISAIPHNIGIKQSTGDLLIFCEAEILHVENTLAAVLAHMQTDNFVVMTQVWTIQEKIYQALKEEEFQNPARILNHPYAQLTSSSNLENTKAPNSDWAITGSNNCVTGCCFAVWKKDMVEIGGYDEDFDGHGFDDWDVFARLGLLGRKPLYLNEPPIIHQWHKKEYPYNIYDAAERNGKKSADRIKAGEYRANINKEWGIL
jgi:predicted glycosyltransferase involved in capsule biosynthesis